MLRRVICSSTSCAMTAQRSGIMMIASGAAAASSCLEFVRHVSSSTWWSSPPSSPSLLSLSAMIMPFSPATPLLVAARRTHASAATLSPVKEEDTDSSVEGLDGLASHSFQPHTVSLVTIGWHPSPSPSSSSGDVASSVVFCVNARNGASGGVGEKQQSTTSQQLAKSFDISNLAASKSNGDLDVFRNQVRSFLVSAVKAVNPTAKSVVLLPFQKDATFQVVVNALNGFSRSGDLCFFVASSDVWSQVHLMYADHRRKIKTFPSPDSLADAYRHINGSDFTPTPHLLDAAGAGGGDETAEAGKQANAAAALLERHAAAVAAELALETMIGAVQRLQPPPKVVSSSQKSSGAPPPSRRDIAALQACTKVVRPVNYFFLRVDNQMAKSVRDKTAIRIELYNPQKQQLNRIDLTSLKDPKLVSVFEAAIASDLNSATAVFLSGDTPQSAALSIMRGIKAKNPVFFLTPAALAAYIDGDDVAVVERFADGFQFSHDPKSMWQQLSSAVKDPSAVVKAIVGATYHRLKVAKSFSWHSGAGVVPKQTAMAALFSQEALLQSLSSSSAGDATTSSAAKDSSSGAPAPAPAAPAATVGAVPRAANAHAVANEAFTKQQGGFQQRFRTYKSERELRVEQALEKWTAAIYSNAARSAREEAAAQKLQRYLVLDVETTTKSKYRRIANPFTGENYVVLPGGLDHTGKIWMPPKYLKSKSELVLPDLSGYDVLVGHNIKFDLFFVWEQPELRKFLSRGGIIWDTMYAEYLLSGQETRLGWGAGLDDVAASYGGKLRKLDEVKEAWNKGVQTFDIPYKTLSEYLRGDLSNTDLIFKMQRARALAQKQVQIINHRMDSLLCTTEMEYNGLMINVPLGRDMNEKLIAETAKLKQSMDEMIPAEIPASRRCEFNWGSLQHMQCLFFGGALKFDPTPSSTSWRTASIASSSSSSSSSSPDGIKKNPISTYSGVGGAESHLAPANLAYLSHNLQGKLFKGVIKPYLRARGLRTTAALEEAFSDKEVEEMFETFFYAVEMDREVSSAADLVDLEQRNVTNFSVVNLFHNVAFEGTIAAAASAAAAADVKKSCKRTTITTSSKGAVYNLETTFVTAPTFDALKVEINVWINMVLTSTNPKKKNKGNNNNNNDNEEDEEEEIEENLQRPRTALLLGRRNAELYEPIFDKKYNFTSRSFKSDRKTATRMVFGDDASIELCAAKHFPVEAKKTMYGRSNNSNDDVSPYLFADPDIMFAREQADGGYIATTAASSSSSSASSKKKQEQQQQSASKQVQLSALERATLFGDRAIKLSGVIFNEYVTRKQAFFANGGADGPGAGKAPRKMADLPKVIYGIDNNDCFNFVMKGVPQPCILDSPFVSIPAEEQQIAAESSSSSPVAAVASPAGKSSKNSNNKAGAVNANDGNNSNIRLQQLRFLRVFGSQLKDEDSFAVRLDAPPPDTVELKGRLSTFVASEAERRALALKFTSPDTKKLQVGEETLSYFAKTHNDEVAKTILDLRANEKQLSTYFEDKKSGMMALVHKNDSRIHHELIHNKTATGRLSSSNPNCQNIPKEDKSTIRELFVSRFGPDEGVCIEADYSQLEVVTLCCLSQDKQMTEDLKNKVDFHCKRVAMMKPEYTYDEVVLRAKKNKEPAFVKLRSAAKIFSFQRQYGAGVKMLSESTGLSPEEIKGIIHKEKQVYAGTDLFYDVVALSCHTFDPTLQNGARNQHGDPYYKGVFPVLTGSRYIFTQSDVPFEVMPGELTTNYSPTHLKNYPVQGFAGEIVQIMLGVLYRHFVKNNNYGGKALLTNTVHDCVWIDARREVAAEVAADVSRILGDARTVLNESWPEIRCEVEFPVDVVIGKNMGHLTGVTEWNKKQQPEQQSPPAATQEKKA